jgi:hypothetical protein
MQAEQTLEYALYPIQEVKQLYMIKTQYERLLIQLDQLHKENLALKQQLTKKLS